jgi:RsiW-degrading membrane proteinase PrsW (M82 family)
MKRFINSAQNVLNNTALKVAVALTSMAVSGSALAQANQVDLTKDTSNGKKFGDIATNVNTAAQQGASLLVQLCALGGFVVVAISLYTLWKASKDEREKPMSAVVGLFIGGAMAGIGSIMWMMKNTVTG